MFRMSGASSDCTFVVMTSLMLSHDSTWRFTVMPSFSASKSEMIPSHSDLVWSL